VVFEPADFVNCTGAHNYAIDEDGDHYSNGDEIDNGTDPCSAADVPPDGYAFVVVPDHLGAVPFARNAQAGLLLPPLQAGPLSPRIIVQTPLELDRWPDLFTRDIIARLRKGLLRAAQTCGSGAPRGVHRSAILRSGVGNKYQHRVDASPTRESELIELTRDYDTLQKIYTSLLTKSEDAKVAANVESLLQLLDPPPQLVIIDLNARSQPLEAMKQLRSAQPQLQVIGFLSHVQTSLADQAKSAGFNEVMPRSKFSMQLPDILASAVARHD